MEAWPVDESYLPTFQIQLKTGRNFSAQFPTDSSAIIINETAAKLFGGADPVNKKLYLITDLHRQINCLQYYWGNKGL